MAKNRVRPFGLLLIFLFLFPLIFVNSSMAANSRISAGKNHIIALKSDGTLWAWGYNHFGQLGLGDATTADSHSPVKIGTDNNWASIAAGGFYTIALKSDGTLWAWGANLYGQLGDSKTDDEHSPVKIGYNWVAIGGDTITPSP